MEEKSKIGWKIPIGFQDRRDLFLIREFQKVVCLCLMSSSEGLEFDSNSYNNWNY